MIWFYAAAVLYALSIIFFKKPKFGYLLSTLGSVSVCVLGIIGLSKNIKIGFLNLGTGMDLKLGIDHLSAAFLIVTSVALAAISAYSMGTSTTEEKVRCFFFGATAISMLLITGSMDAVTMMIGWESMTLFVFLSMQKNGFDFKSSFGFLAFGEVSSIALIAGFAVLYMSNGSTLFGKITQTPSLFLVLVSIGYTVKMDVFPFHTWMKKAYSALPAKTLAVLSVPVTLMGIYGIERMVTLSGYPEWWGIVFMIFGAFSAFWGGLQASGANGMKILPAYSTVENNGTILAAIGFFALGMSGKGIGNLENFAVATSFLLIVAHAVSKTLLFLSIDQIQRNGKGSDSMEETRGTWNENKVPTVGVFSSVLSFGAFPPTVGFVGEWMVLEMFFQSYRFPRTYEVLIAAFCGVFISLAMGLGNFSMIKLAGYTVLGGSGGRDAGFRGTFSMNAAQIFLSVLLFASGILSPFVLRMFGFGSFTSGLLGVPSPLLIISNVPIFGVTSPTIFAVIFAVFFAGPSIVYLSRSKKVRTVDSWNGGIKQSKEESFTVHSYSYTLKRMLAKFYLTREKVDGKALELRTADVADYPYEYAKRSFAFLGKVLAKSVMNGKIYAYILYITAMFILVFFLANL